MRELPAILVALVALGGCAALAPDRTLQSTMTLAPGQSVTGRFDLPGGGPGYVQFQRQAPVKGVAPYPEATTYVGDGMVLITFLDEPRVPAETPLGYASWSLSDRRSCRVVLRNADSRPATFDWMVTASSDATADWDVSTSPPPRN